MRDTRLAEDMRRAQQRELRSLTNAADAASTDLLVAASAASADGQVDDALQRAMAGRQAARELASLRGSKQDDASPLVAPGHQAQPHPVPGTEHSSPDPRDALRQPTANWISSAEVADGVTMQTTDVGWHTEQLNPELFSLPSLGAAERTQVGRWGERLCYEHLRRRLGADPRVVIDWLNQEVESGLPYVCITSLRMPFHQQQQAPGACSPRDAPRCGLSPAPQLSQTRFTPPPTPRPRSHRHPVCISPRLSAGLESHLLLWRGTVRGGQDDDCAGQALLRGELAGAAVRPTRRRGLPCVPSIGSGHGRSELGMFVGSGQVCGVGARLVGARAWRG
jgi:hypothetical protein